MTVLKQHFDGKAAAEKVGVRPILFWWSEFIHNQVFPLSALGEILPKTKVSVS